MYDIPSIEPESPSRFTIVSVDPKPETADIGTLRQMSKRSLSKSSLAESIRRAS